MLSNYKKYFEKISSNLDHYSAGDFIKKSIDLINLCKKNQGKILIVGNGGSAAIASHVSVDLVKAAGIRSINFNEADLITCFANDYGYENWVAEGIKAYSDQNDLLIAISSSGMSKNIINGVLQAKKLGNQIITFSGFNENNALKKLGNINFWLDSKEYNVVEMVHHIWLLAIVEELVNKQRD